MEGFTVYGRNLLADGSNDKLRTRNHPCIWRAREAKDAIGSVLMKPVKAEECDKNRVTGLTRWPRKIPYITPSTHYTHRELKKTR